MAMARRPNPPTAPGPTAQAADGDWAKTPFTNLIRYVPSGTYFARVRIQGRLIRRSLKTKVLSVAKLRLTDLENAERRTSERQTEAVQGKMSVGEATRLLESRIDADVSLKPLSRSYYHQRLAALFKSWPDLKERDVRTITQKDCMAWGSRFAQATCGSAFNNTLGVLRQLFDIAVELGVRYENPASTTKRVTVRPKDLHLPSASQFKQFVAAIEFGGGRHSRKCADLVRFLAYGGFRLGEAKNVTWADCDLQKKEILVRGDAETGTKNRSVRRVPMIEEMVQLITRFRLSRGEEPPEALVVEVRECQKAMNRGAKEVKMRRITHHDLRHLFATRCIEAGVDIPTVSRWLGHKDGGALAMKVYGHLRDEHSQDMAQKVTFEPKLSATSDASVQVRRRPVPQPQVPVEPVDG